MSKTQICFDYREKYGWDMPTLKLARIVYNDNPLLFTSLDNARSMLRGIEGKTQNRVKVRKQMPERPKNPYKLPESENKANTKNFVLLLYLN
jgi:hypothetical protein